MFKEGDNVILKEKWKNDYFWKNYNKGILKVCMHPSMRVLCVWNPTTENEQYTSHPEKYFDLVPEFEYEDVS